MKTQQNSNSDSIAAQPSNPLKASVFLESGDFAKKIGAVHEGKARTISDVLDVASLAKTPDAQGIACLFSKDFLKAINAHPQSLVVLCVAKLSPEIDPKHTRISLPSEKIKVAFGLLLAHFDARRGLSHRALSLQWSNDAQSAPIPSSSAPTLDESFVHPSSVVADGVKIGNGVYVGPLCVIEAGAVLEDGVHLHASVSLGACVFVGAKSRIGRGVCVADGTHIGRDCEILDGALLGQIGFSTTSIDGVNARLSHLGGLEIGNGVSIGAGTNIDAGLLRPTRIGDHVMIDGLVKIGHNTSIGEGTVVAGMCAIAGSTEIGKHCVIAGCASISDHTIIGDHAVVHAAASVHGNVPEHAAYAGTFFAMDHQKWMRLYRKILRFSRGS